MAVILSLCVLFFSCAPANKGPDVTDYLTLSLNEFYSFTDICPEQVPSSWTFESDDPDVADVVNGTRIEGFETGNATVIVNMDGDIHVYDVTVEDKSDEDRWISVTEVGDDNAYLGYCFNVFKLKDFLTAEDVITVPLLPIAKENMVQSTGVRTLKDICSGDTTSSYTDNYSEKISGQLGVKIPAYQVKGKAKAAFQDSKTSSEKEENRYTSIIAYNVLRTYSIKMSPKKMQKKIQDDEDIWDALTGADGTTPEEFFEYFGTHMIRDVVVGGRMNLDYRLTKNDKTNTSFNLKDISGEIEANIAGAVDVEGKARYENKKTKSATDRGLSIKTNIQVVGGPEDLSSVTPSGIDDFGEKYHEWLKQLKISNGAVIIGTNNPLKIWSFLDTNDPEQKKRYDAFEKAYEKLSTAGETEETNTTTEPAKKTSFFSSIFAFLFKNSKS